MFKKISIILLYIATIIGGALAINHFFKDSEYIRLLLLGIFIATVLPIFRTIAKKYKKGAPITISPADKRELTYMKCVLGSMLCLLIVFIITATLSIIEKDRFFVFLYLTGVLTSSIASIIFYRRYKKFQQSHEA
ncbi:hypothetical protein [Metasolibacillus meyeri]|uniref:hypothetical protein n=1 Tax=Metasolibacillus meyeri TaxID=1071052 RepID=UPI000D3221AE|nr:hypothetical protein [Metasolibacillus meyeri]